MFEQAWVLFGEIPQLFNLLNSCCSFISNGLLLLTKHADCLQQKMLSLHQAIPITINKQKRCMFWSMRFLKSDCLRSFPLSCSRNSAVDRNEEIDVTRLLTFSEITVACLHGKNQKASLEAVVKLEGHYVRRRRRENINEESFNSTNRKWIGKCSLVRKMSVMFNSNISLVFKVDLLIFAPFIKNTEYFPLEWIDTGIIITTTYPFLEMKCTETNQLSMQCTACGELLGQISSAKLSGETFLYDSSSYFIDVKLCLSTSNSCVQLMHT
ncbi:hypothetical protein D918_09678 [Trichuris suis]|nr:hypothetical protein D918_09678 [Trichuris suis]